MNRSFRVTTLILLLALTVLPAKTVFAQPLTNPQIRELITQFKKDERGPYQAIRWFCPDGTVIPPKERCPMPGGIQHALARDVVAQLARDNQIYLGQILAGSDPEVFLDRANLNMRLKQYQLEKFLFYADDGWILRRARYYRGAIQAEDEEAWGRLFMENLAADDEFIQKNYFLLLQAAKDIPHAANEDHWQKIRAVSKTLSDSIPAFMDLRIKLHGQPARSDLLAVTKFREKNQKNMKPEWIASMLELEAELQLAYRETGFSSLEKYTRLLGKKSIFTEPIKELINCAANDTLNRYQLTSNLLWKIRAEFTSVSSPRSRLRLLDLANDLEDILFRNLRPYQARTINELLTKNYIFAQAVAACGFLEIWEWEYVKPFLLPPQTEEITLERFMRQGEYIRRMVEWGSSTVRANYFPVQNLFTAFEPLAVGFIDDRIRSSVLLPLGETAAQIGRIAARESGIRNRIMDTAESGDVRGVNPGFAVGELVVVTGNSEKVDLRADKIYFLAQPPADMKPVAGIATVSEGNLVSHVQLLARNLGIPNANVSDEIVRSVQKYSGQKVFYAVSPRGRVVLIPATEMSAAEKAMVEVKQRTEERIRVPTQKLDLKNTSLPGLRKIRAADSGKLCGPKAANLGQLKSLFPDKVVEGFVVPFGVFREHMDQEMSKSGMSYWQFLSNTFQIAQDKLSSGVNSNEVDNFVLEKLATLREAIKSIPLSEEFSSEFAKKFREELGKSLGEVPVFIRSDTNMEDLKDFTGAGLNLTVFNVRDKEKIFQAIRDVWASPFTERSYRWRQRFLLNPENVYPSILVIPGVNVEKSGVMITANIVTGDTEQNTVAFSRGAGGAVEGQVAETYLLKADGSAQLLSPAREKLFTVLPQTGGTAKEEAWFDQPVLSTADLQALADMAGLIRQRLPGTPGISGNGPFDVELGFRDGRIWLFQIRPYVENKRARSSDYLRSLDKKLPAGKAVNLNEDISAKEGY
jgi:hypothetical protein